MFPKQTLPTFVVLLVASSHLMACGSYSKPGLQSSNSLHDWEDPSQERVAYLPKDGRLDGVEFHINQNLTHDGLVRDGLVVAHRSAKKRNLPELKSIFEHEDKQWRPQKESDIPIVRNEMVDKWVKTFTGPLRKNYARWLKRAGMYAPVMEEILAEYGLPKDLIYLSMIESGYNMHAFSHASASGPWQFIRSTGSMYGLKSQGIVDERRDLLKATRAAAEHLRDLHQTYGDWYLAFAAYNAGPGTVNRAISRLGSKNYWTLASPRSRYFRSETKNYVPKILAAAIIAKDYRKYGFSPDIFEKPLKFDVVKVANATDVEVIAQCARSSVDEIKFLNPSIYMGVTPPGESYAVLIPEGGTKDFYKRYEDISAKKRTRYSFHQIKQKTTLPTLAKQYHVPINQLASLNRLDGKSKLVPGKLLIIPNKKGENFPVAPEQTLLAQATLGQAPSGQAQPALAPQTLVADSGLSDAISTTIADELKPSITQPVEKTRESYRVKRGDTLLSIAQNHNVYVKDLKSWNRIGAKGKIRAGQALLVAPPQPETLVASAVNNTPVVGPVIGANTSQAGSYRVRLGDTLGEIAQKHSMKLSALKELNAIADLTITPGQILKVTGTNSAMLTKTIVAVTDDQDRKIIHAVRKGENLWDIARKYRVSVPKLKAWNDLKNDQIKPNQKIIIYA